MKERSLPEIINKNITLQRYQKTHNNYRLQFAAQLKPVMWKPPLSYDEKNRFYINFNINLNDGHIQDGRPFPYMGISELCRSTQTYSSASFSSYVLIIYICLFVCLIICLF